jgi:hypothetical protein
MNWNEVESLWKEAAPQGDDASPAQLLEVVNRRSSKFRRQVAWRNVREVAAGLAVAAICGWFAFHQPDPVQRVGMGVIAASGVWIVVYLLKFGYSGKAPDANADLSTYCRLLSEDYGRQAKLLRRVKYWYLLPPYVGNLIIFGDSLHRRLVAGQSTLAAWVGLGGFTSVFVAVWILNERYAARHIDRLQNELRQMAEGESA